ncbi:Zinc finger MIZ domain-containing protein 1 [Cytospora mali]|uniref:Zinc finger MIZ domain-containing protein 1 n=1 Tax=Cytospora mali TaxID=578113 RepID=A0A194W809_CYTMA|nr:Zinc finger MIZ domain-containing protein 1 [Valsa mali]
MPGSSSAHSGLQGAFNNQVIHANTTLNAFVGGKQKAWMLNAPPVQPSPRPPRSQQAQQPTPQPPTTPANLLPSPAPSDEPSPAVSNPRDSPNPRTLSVMTAAQRQNTGQVQTVQAASLADLHLRSGDTTPAVTEAVTGDSGRPPTTANATAVTSPYGLQSPLAMAPPILPDAHQTGHVANASSRPGPVVIDLERTASQAPSAPDGSGHPNKRRRIESSSSPSVGEKDTSIFNLTATIDARINQIGGIDALMPDVERPRFQLLRDACDAKDIFYLTLHKLYCLWSLDDKKASSYLRCDPESVRIGFGIVTTVLKKNDGFYKSNLAWCAHFPGRSLDPRRNPTVIQIAIFLSSLAQHWTALHDNTFNRHYPYLMDELVGQLQCYSTVLQKLLFTAARRRMGILDGPLGIEIEAHFRRDQEEHFIDGQFRTFASPHDPGGLEKRNERLIHCYREIFAKAWTEHELREEQRRQQQPHDQQHPRQQQHLQQQQQRQMMIQQQRVQQNQAQQMQTHSPQQALAQQQLPPQAATHVDHQYDQYDQSRASAAIHARRLSRQNSRSMNSPRMSTMSPQTAAAHYTMASPPILRSALSPPVLPGRQPGEIPQNLVLHSSPTMNPASSLPMMQSMSSPQAYIQGLPSPQQYNFANCQSTIHNMQNSLYGLQYMHQWPGGMNTGQPVSNVQFMPPIQFGAPQPDGAATMARTPTQQQMNQIGSPITSWPRPTPTFVPRPGQVIERSDHPHSHHEKKSLVMSLHQAHARSPDRTRRMEDADERFYQYIRSFAIEPFLLEYYHPALNFMVTPEDYSLRCKKKHVPLLNGQKPVLTVREYTNGSLRYRLRCCQVNSDRPVAESEWVIKETSWPDHIFPHFNQEKLVVRRGTHHGKDLPVELTDFVVPGVNMLKVALTGAARAHEKKAKRYYMAVEVLETLSHSQVLEHIWANGLSDREETLEKIRKRVNAVPEEDGIAVIDRTGTTTSELSIDLTDPFSASIFAVPARGATCTHMECFDLETWLNTRPTKQAIRCSHQKVCTCPKYIEPSEPDKWKCPICFADARPRSLRIDSFLLDVRRRLEQLNKLETKSILVAADGTWRAVAELIEDDDAGSDGDGPTTRGPVAASRKQPSKSRSVERAVEIIELD